MKNAGKPTILPICAAFCNRPLLRQHRKKSMLKQQYGFIQAQIADGVHPKNGS
ncbi:hypothetical protein [Methylobacter svalbardensis]|uniref:hypothetical protein n=1 Tax=Methylobacter svalbardensis TaxID=3080016 RepID=UPI0030EBE774